MKHKPSHIFEYILLRLFAGFIRALPLRLALSLGWVGARLTHTFGKKKTNRTRQRLREVFGDSRPEKEIRRIAWLSWRNLFFSGIEMMRNDRLTLEKIRKHPMASLEPRLKEIRAETDGGFILATPHMGSWEMAGIAADLSGIPLVVIVKKQKNPLINDYINRMRSTFNMDVVRREDKVFKSIVEKLKQGKVLAILPDIHSKSKSNAVTVDYLNNKATIAPGTAQFSQLVNCPVYPIIVRRVGWTKHDATLFDPIYPDLQADKDADQQRIMQEIMTVFTQEILKTPEHYFWHNKRWVLQK